MALIRSSRGKSMRSMLGVSLAAPCEQQGARAVRCPAFTSAAARFCWLLASSMAPRTRQCANWPGGAADFTLRNLPSGPGLWNPECRKLQSQGEAHETDDLAGHGRGLCVDACRNRVGAAAAAAAAGTCAAARAAREGGWQHADAEGAGRSATHGQCAGQCAGDE